MSMSDTISDVLTRMRNASQRRFSQVVVPYSKKHHSIVRVFEQEGFVESVMVDESSLKKTMSIGLKYYGPQKSPVCATIKRVSRPGLRVYKKWNEIPRNGFGIYVVSTSQGMMSDHDARARRLGGELICKISTVKTEG